MPTPESAEFAETVDDCASDAAAADGAELADAGMPAVPAACVMRAGNAGESDGAAPAESRTIDCSRAQDPETGRASASRVRALGEAAAPAIVEARRAFHRHPELSGHELHTCEMLCEQLDDLGIPYRRVANNGILATIAGTAPGAYDEAGRPRRRVALRTDIDALPVTEKTGEPFASEREGVMHACGHDAHMAMMLGAVRILSSMTDALAGEVRVIFQPAEEISIGALSMIEAGALEGVDAIYGAHIWSEVDAGEVSCAPGQRMANTDWFRVDIEGVSAHGSMPHKGVDAVVVGAELVMSLQVLVSRDVSPFEPVVVTVGEFHGGEARNIMAGRAWLTGTVRTWSSELRAEVPERLERIVKKVASAFGAKATFTFEQGNAGLANDADCAEVARRAVIDVLGEAGVADYRGTLSGEDFSEYLRYVPGVFCFVGTRNPAVGATHPQHSCYYTIDESVLPKGSMVAAQWACRMLAE